jgi:hypothetical protein
MPPSEPNPHQFPPSPYTGLILRDLCWERLLSCPSVAYPPVSSLPMPTSRIRQATASIALRCLRLPIWRGSIIPLASQYLDIAQLLPSLPLSPGSSDHPVPLCFAIFTRGLSWLLQYGLFSMPEDALLVLCTVGLALPLLCCPTSKGGELPGNSAYQFRGSFVLVV